MKCTTADCKAACNNGSSFCVQCWVRLFDAERETGRKILACMKYKSAAEQAEALGKLNLFLDSMIVNIPEALPNG